MEATHTKKWLSPLWFILTGFSLALTLFFTHRYRTTQSAIVQFTKQEAREKTAQAAQHLNSFITMLQPMATALAKKLENNTVKKSTVIKQLQAKPVEISGFGVVFVSHDEDDKQEAQYVVEHEDKQQLVQLNTPYSAKASDLARASTNTTNNRQENYDYTQKVWYKNALQGQSGFVGPINDPVTKNPVIIFYAPFHDTDDKEKEIAGVVFATQSIAHLKHILSTLYLGQAGYWFVTDKNGKALIHPKTSFVKNKQNMIDKAHMHGNDMVATLLGQGENRTKSSLYKNPVTNNAAWLSVSATQIAQLNVVSVFDIYQVFANNDVVRRQLIHIILAFLCTLLFCIAFFITRIRLNIPLLWAFSAVIAFTFALTIGVLWAITNTYPDYKENILPIHSKIGLYQFLDQLDNAKQTTIPTEPTQDLDYYLRYRYKKDKYVPTGLMIHDIDFVSEDQIEFVGIIWQRYFDGIHDDVSRGFIFQQLSGKPDIIELSRTKEGKRETIVWLVHTKLNQIMSYYKFPFDVKDLHIQLSHKDFDKNIILVPDLDAYTVLNAAALPGVSNDAHLSGWQLSGSYFGYKLVDYQSNFGMYHYGPFGTTNQVDKSQVPELHFTVAAKRNLFETLTTHVIVLLAIAFLLFVLFLTYQERGIGNTGSAFTGILFSNIVAQRYFKSYIPSDEFVYFEWFHFIMYLAIVFVVTVALLDFFKFDIWFIQYKKNLISRLLYWPCLLMAILLASIAYLY